MAGRTRARGWGAAIVPMLAASVAGAAGPGLTQDSDLLTVFLAPAAGERTIMNGAPADVGEGAFWRWAGTSGLGPRELMQAGLNEAELLELVCQFADDIDMARAAGGGAFIDSGRTLVERAGAGREVVRRRMEARPITETPDLPEDVSARPECHLAPEPEDVAAMLADAPGAAPYLIERRLRQTVRRTSTIRILALPDAQQRGGDAP